MPTNVLMEKYKEEVCVKCKNKCIDKNVCDIRVTTVCKETEARCINYERERNRE